MSQTQPDSFNDPSLKRAIQRAWGHETAPDAVQARVQAACAQRAPGDASTPVSPQSALSKSASPRSWRWPGPAFGLAAAAMVLIAVGLFLRFHHTTSPGTDPNPAQTAIELPRNLADELVARHNACCAADDHHMPGISRDNFALIGQQLSAKLGFPVLSAPLPGEWDFHGASVCPVGTTHSGHLVFHRSGGNEFVSIFSLPHQFVSGAIAAGDCAQVDQRHPIAGFATADGFYCLVGSSGDASLTLDRVRAMRDRLRNDVGHSTASAAPRITLAASH